MNFELNILNYKLFGVFFHILLKLIGQKEKGIIQIPRPEKVVGKIRVYIPNAFPNLSLAFKKRKKSEETVFSNSLKRTPCLSFSYQCCQLLYIHNS